MRGGGGGTQRRRRKDCGKRQGEKAIERETQRGNQREAEGQSK